MSIDKTRSLRGYALRYSSLQAVRELLAWQSHTARSTPVAARWCDRTAVCRSMTTGPVTATTSSLPHHGDH
jgi:hypothetical protein